MKQLSQPFVTAARSLAGTTCCWSSKATLEKERLREALNWAMEAFVISGREKLNGKVTGWHHFIYFILHDGPLWVLDEPTEGKGSPSADLFNKD